MKKIKKLLFFFIILAIIIIPLPAGDMTIRLQLTEMVGNDYALHYSNTDSFFTPSKSIAGEIDYEKNQVIFHLDNSLEGLTALRLDFPHTDTLISVEKITVSSAGIIQKQFNPSLFFAPGNLIETHDLEAISQATAQDKAYLATSDWDPYVVLSEKLVKQIDSGFSHFHLSRLAICLFIAACTYFTKKDYFTNKE